MPPECCAPTGTASPTTAPGRDKDLPDPWYGDYGDFVDTLAVIERSTPALVDYVRP